MEENKNETRYAIEQRTSSIYKVQVVYINYR